MTTKDHDMLSCERKMSTTDEYKIHSTTRCNQAQLISWKKYTMWGKVFVELRGLAEIYIKVKVNRNEESTSRFNMVTEESVTSFQKATMITE